MSLYVWERLTSVIAVLMLGVMAGFFWTYTFNVNLATAQLDGATYATVQSLFNQNVRHGMFFLFFFGGGGATLLALAVNYQQWRTSAFWLLASAAVIYSVGIIVFTHEVNLPLNYYTESWNPAALPADWQQIREQWNSANALRVVSAGTAFVLGLLSLVVRK